MHGRIDLVQNSISPSLLPVAARAPDITIDSAPGINLTYMGFKLDDPVLAHAGVRRAIAMAIDRQKLIAYQLGGYAVPAQAPLPPQNWAAAAGIAAPAYDPKAAKALLDAAGFSDPDGNGPLPRLTLSYKTSVQKDRIEMALLIAEFLKAVGIAVTVESREWGTFFRDIKDGRFQLFSLTWVGLMDPDILYHMFHSQSLPPNGGNRGHYRSAIVDAAVAEARQDYDPATRKHLYQAAQQALAHDLPYVLLWYDTNIVVRHRSLCGYSLWPNASFRSLSKVYRGECNDKSKT